MRACNLFFLTETQPLYTWYQLFFGGINNKMMAFLQNYLLKVIVNHLI